MATAEPALAAFAATVCRQGDFAHCAPQGGAGGAAAAVKSGVFKVRPNRTIRGFSYPSLMALTETMGPAHLRGSASRCIDIALAPELPPRGKAERTAPLIVWSLYPAQTSSQLRSSS